MTTVDQKRFSYYRELERVRNLLKDIPDQEVAAAHLAKHDELVAAETPRGQFRAVLGMVEPAGTEQLDFAVPLYLDEVYSRQDLESVDWNDAWTDAEEAKWQFDELEAMRERALSRVPSAVPAAVREAAPAAAPVVTLVDDGLSYNEELEGRGFAARVRDLKSAHRIDESTEQQLQGMVAASSSIEELRARMHHTVATRMGEAEFRYLDTTLSTPLGQRPETWAQAETYARAFDTGQSLTPEHMQRVDHDQKIHAAPSIS